MDSKTTKIYELSSVTKEQELEELRQQIEKMSGGAATLDDAKQVQGRLLRLTSEEARTLRGMNRKQRRAWLSKRRSESRAKGSSR
jgi:urease accessory protein UreH